MSEVKFNDGDRVRLKSGGPTMTVTDATEQKIECSWFVEENIQHSSFNPKTLKIFEAKKRTASASE